MAEDAKLHGYAGSAMSDHWIVAIVAGRRVDYRPGHLHGRTIGNEVENVVGRFTPLVIGHELGQIPLSGNTDGMRDGGIEARGRFGFERVGIVAVGIGRKRSARIVSRLSLRRIVGDRRGGYAGGVRDVLFLTRRDVRGDEA